LLIAFLFTWAASVEIKHDQSLKRFLAEEVPVDSVTANVPLKNLPGVEYMQYAYNELSGYSYFEGGRSALKLFEFTYLEKKTIFFEDTLYNVPD
jgi:hypothetical protein